MSSLYYDSLLAPLEIAIDHALLRSTFSRLLEEYGDNSREADPTKTNDTHPIEENSINNPDSRLFPPIDNKRQTTYANKSFLNQSQQNTSSKKPTPYQKKENHKETEKHKQEESDNSRINNQIMELLRKQTTLIEAKKKGKIKAVFFLFSRFVFFKKKIYERFLN